MALELQTGCTKIQQQAALHEGRLQLIYPLCVICTREFGDCLRLHQKVVVANKVGSVAARKQLAFVTNGQWHLSTKWNLSILEFYSESTLVNCFEKPAPKLAMHCHRGTYNCMALLIVLHFNLRKSAKSADYFAASFSS